MITIWERFVKTLETEGGKMAVLLTMIAFLLFVASALVLTNHPLKETARTIIATAIGSLLGILYGYLRRNGK